MAKNMLFMVLVTVIACLVLVLAYFVMILSRHKAALQVCETEREELRRRLKECKEDLRRDGEGFSVSALGEENMPQNREDASDEGCVMLENANVLLSRNIRECGLPTRIWSCLYASGVKTLGDLCARTEDDLLMLRGFGKTALKETEQMLSELGLTLGSIR